MSDPYENLINDALGDFHAVEADTPGLVPDVSSVRATVARRRTLRLATLSVLGALLIAVPIAAFAAAPHGDDPAPATTGTVSPTPAEPASPTAVPTSPTASTPAGPDGRITLKELAANPVDLPALGWPCPAARRKLATSESQPPNPWLAKVVHTNLDDDPAQETAALLFCPTGGEVPLGQVVAFDRNDAGRIRTLGLVVGSGDMRYIRDIRARVRGGITADVSDDVACCAVLPSSERHQDRDYAWNGAAFAQVGGPTVFGDPRYVTDLQLTVTEMTLAPAVDGKRLGTATVTVRNNGPRASGRFNVSLGNCSFDCRAVDFPGWAWGDSGTYHAPLDAGQSISTTISATWDANTPVGTIQAELRVVGRTDTKEMTDLDPDNNRTVFWLRRT